MDGVRVASPVLSAELSVCLQQLSGRAKAAHQHITLLKTMQDRVTSHCDTLAAALERQCAELAEAVAGVRERLHSQLQAQREATAHTYRDSAGSCTRRLQQTTALVQFCIEAIKEPDSAAFLQVTSPASPCTDTVYLPSGDTAYLPSGDTACIYLTLTLPTFLQMGPHLTGRVSDLDLAWDKELSSHPASELSPYLPLDLDHQQALRAINSFNFITMKPARDGEDRLPAGKTRPASSLEVHRGPETICSVEGLQFNTVYTLRVKASNASGDSPYSVPIAIRTAPGAWFPLIRSLSHPDCAISDQGATVTCDSYEQRVAASGVGFTRGRHYWQFRIDAYDANADVAFGVVRKQVNKEVMLGNDEHGWAMYIDHQRSWFLHGSTHHGRCEGGIGGVGAIVGVLLEWRQQKASISFYVNYEQQGDVAFTDVEGPLFPAVSVNRNVCVSLHTSLEAPTQLTQAVRKTLQSTHCRSLNTSLDASILETSNLPHSLQNMNVGGHSDYDSQSDT
ncbi:SPRY domain [Trinorchestia longiramus]|nr:SPRY domain [Trinorchestia longiramus]